MSKPEINTFQDENSKCKYRVCCAGYIEGLCFNSNHVSEDEWCKLHGKGQLLADRRRMKYTSVKRSVNKV